MVSNGANGEFRRTGERPILDPQPISTPETSTENSEEGKVEDSERRSAVAYVREKTKWNNTGGIGESEIVCEE